MKEQPEIQAQATEFSRLVPISRVDLNGYDVTIEAKEPERRLLAARLKVRGIEQLSCRYRLSVGHAAGQILAEGQISARLRRDCVVTLEPFVEVIEEGFSVYFVPRRELERRERAQKHDSEDFDFDAELPDEVPYDRRELDIGEEAVAQIALMMDPYPRKDGAQHPVGVDVVPSEDEISDQELVERKENPFAALASLKGKPQ